MVYVEEKLVKNNVYYYHTRSIRLGNKIKKIRRFVGRSKSEAYTLHEFKKSVEYIADKELELIHLPHDLNLFTYSKTVISYVFKQNVLVSNLKEFSFEISSKINMRFPIVFIYNSNSIEGSRIPMSEVEKIINGRKTVYKDKNEIQEVLNSIACWKYVQDDFKFNLKSIKFLHALLTKGLLSSSGSSYTQGFKKVPIVVGPDARPTAPPEEVKERLQQLLNWYNENRNKIFPLQLAFDFYYKFELIHPFEDGNGRVGRFIMNKIMMDLGYQPLIVFTQNTQSHHKAFVRAEGGNMKYFYDFMFKQYRKTFDEFYNKYLS